MDRTLMEQCTCLTCPSFVDCSEQTAYCFPEIETSRCIIEELGCNCPGCPVYQQEGFTGEYFCMRGSEL